ncbi:MAG: hypothetical protein KF858_15270, partial [Candidatus Sumerlaeia bacterium]|nr:hypothetical protein [Candidatus Sumerlaeia bacterium]
HRPPAVVAFWLLASLLLAGVGRADAPARQDGATSQTATLRLGDLFRPATPTPASPTWRRTEPPPVPETDGSVAQAPTDSTATPEPERDILLNVELPYLPPRGFSVTPLDHIEAARPLLAEVGRDTAATGNEAQITLVHRGRDLTLEWTLVPESGDEPLRFRQTPGTTERLSLAPGLWSVRRRIVHGRGWDTVRDERFPAQELRAGWSYTATLGDVDERALREDDLRRSRRAPGRRPPPVR